MKALQFTALDHAELVELPIPTPAPDEVLIRVGAAGICHTDLDILRGHYPAQFPVTPGHEFAGDVIEVGTAVDRSWLRRAVAVDPLIFCRQCAWCRAGRTNLCQSLRAYGAEINGGAAEFVSVRADSLVDASGIPVALAALAEPLACAENGAQRAAVNADDEVLVVGAGPIGLLLMTAFGQRGASVTIAEPQAARRENARAFGSTAEYQSVAAALESRYGKGFHLVVDVTGRPEVVQQGLTAVSRGGRLMLFGVCPPGSKLTVDPYDIYKREITVLGSFSLNRTLPSAMETLRANQHRLRRLITHELPITDMPTALALLGRPGVLKLQLTFTGQDTVMATAARSSAN